MRSPGRAACGGSRRILGPPATAKVALLFFLLFHANAHAETDYARELKAIQSQLKASAIGESIVESAETPPWPHANLLFRRAIFTEALPDLREAAAKLASLAPSAEAPGLAFGRTRIALDLHSLAEAKRALAMIDDPAQQAVALGLAFDLAMQEGRYDEARRCSLGWDRAGARAEDLCRLAALAAFEGRDTQADAFFARAEEQLSTKEMRLFAWVALQRGSLALRAGRLDAAQLQYGRAAKAYSGWWRVEQRQAELLGAQGRLADAEALYRRLAAEQHCPELDQELGEFLAFEGKTTEAASAYQRALAAYLDSANRGEIIYLHHLVSIYTDGLPNPTEAVRWARADLAARGCASAHDALGWASSAAGDLATAEKEMRAALGTGTREPHILAHASIVFIAAGHRDEARAFLLQPAVAKLLARNVFHAHR